MTNIKLTATKVTGLPDQSGWAQVYSYTHPSDSDHQAYVLIVEQIADEDFDTTGEIERIKKGRNIVGKLQQNIPLELDQEKLSKATRDTLSEFTHKSDNLHICVFYIHKDKLLAVTSGGIGVYLVRHGNIALILPSDSEGSIAGKLQNGDRYSVITDELFAEITLTGLKAGLSSDLAKFSSIINNKINEYKKASNQAFLGINIESIVNTESSDNVDEKQANDIKINKPFYETQSFSPFSFFRKLLVKVIDIILKFLPEPKIALSSPTVDLETKRRRKSAPLVGVILIFILATSIFFGIRKQGQVSYRRSYQDELNTAIHQFEEAQSLVSISPGRARELTLQAQATANDLVGRGIKDPSLDKLVNDISTNLGSIAGIYKSEDQLYLDLSLIASDFVGISLGISNERMLVLDNNTQKLVGIEVKTKKTNTIAGPDYLRTARSTEGYSDRSFILSEDGIRETTGDVELVVRADEWSANDILWNIFAGNIYLLNRSDTTIKKYTGVANGFLDPVDWLADGLNIDFSTATSMSIDGSIWVLYRDGDIDRFSQGSFQPFSVGEMDSDLSSATQIFTDEEIDDLYILDGVNKRIVVLDKQGEYKAEYTADKLKEATDFIVSQENKKIIYLANGRLYEIELKHF